MTTPLRQFILKRGNTDISSTYTGPAGEITYDTTLNAVRVHDGITAGGNLMPSSTGYTFLISNVTILQGNVITLFANAATQATTLTSIDANLGTATTNITALFANAATQATTLISIDANLGTTTTNVTALFANAATQQILIDTINANVAAANALIPNLQAVSSNILPAANVTYSLGSETHQWRDLWVSNNTIYIGNTPIRVSGDTLLVNDVSITSNLDINGTGIAIAAGAAETIITISPSPEGYAYVQVPDDATANTYNLRIHNDIGNIELGTNSGNKLWYFKNNGELSFPGGVVAGEIEGSGTFGFASSSNLTQYILETSATSWTFDGATGALIFEVNQTISTPTAESIKVSAGLGDASGILLDNFGEVELYANTNVYIYTDSATTQQTWAFDNTGDLSLPNNGDIKFNGGGIVQTPDENFRILVIDADDDGFAVQQAVHDAAGVGMSLTQLRRDQFNIGFSAGPQFRFDESGETQLPGNVRWDTYVNQSLYAVADNVGAGTIELKTISYAGDVLGSNVRVSQSAATISTNNAQYTWLFDNTGNLTIPGDSMVTTANAGGGLGGKPITIQGGASDADTWNSNPGGTVNIVGGYGSWADGGGGNGGDVNITGGASSDANPGIVNINSGANTWAFDYQGGLTLPNGHIVGTNNNSLLLWSEAQDTITLRTEDDSSNFYNFIFDTGGNVSVPGRVSADYVVVTGGLISTGASPAPIISGFRSISTGGNYLNGEGNITAAGNLVASRGAFITGNLMVSGNASISNIVYTPTTSSDWAAPAPTTLGQAVDRLAALVKTLNGGTGA